MPKPVLGRTRVSSDSVGGVSLSSAARPPNRMGVTQDNGGWGMLLASASSSAKCKAAGKGLSLASSLSYSDSINSQAKSSPTG